MTAVFIRFFFSSGLSESKLFTDALADELVRHLADAQADA